MNDNFVFILGASGECKSDLTDALDGSDARRRLVRANIGKSDLARVQCVQSVVVWVLINGARERKRHVRAVMKLVRFKVMEQKTEGFLVCFRCCPEHYTMTYHCG